LSDYSVLVRRPVNRDDRHLLAHAMASDFSIPAFHVSEPLGHPLLDLES
jgi:hypothetical protein